MNNWERPPFEPQQQPPPDRFPPRPQHSQGSMNRPFFQPPHHQERYNQSGPPIPPPRGKAQSTVDFFPPTVDVLCKFALI